MRPRKPLIKSSAVTSGWPVDVPRSGGGTSQRRPAGVAIRQAVDNLFKPYENMEPPDSRMANDEAASHRSTVGGQNAFLFLPVLLTTPIGRRRPHRGQYKPVGHNVQKGRGKPRNGRNGNGGILDGSAAIRSPRFSLQGFAIFSDGCGLDIAQCGLYNQTIIRGLKETAPARSNLSRNMGLTGSDC